MDLLVLTLAATATAVATGLGAVPVFFLGERAATLKPWLLGFASGVDDRRVVVGLLLPALDEGSATEPCWEPRWESRSCSPAAG